MALTEVKIAPVPPERFRSLLGDAGYEDVESAVSTAARVLPGRVIWHINSTPRGGGVAEMLQSLLAYARGAGVDVRWAAVSGNPEFFRITKRLHNRLHGAAGDDGELGDAEREVYEQALVPAAEELGKLVSPDDIVYIHDPQPAPLLDMLSDRGVASVWRCHVGVDEPNEIARSAWDFLRPYVAEANAYVFSRREFVWDGFDSERIWIVPLDRRLLREEPGALARGAERSCPASASRTTAARPRSSTATTARSRASTGSPRSTRTSACPRTLR